MSWWADPKPCSFSFHSPQSRAWWLNLLVVLCCGSTRHIPLRCSMRTPLSAEPSEERRGGGCALCGVVSWRVCCGRLHGTRHRVTVSPSNSNSSTTLHHRPHRAHTTAHTTLPCPSRSTAHTLQFTKAPQISPLYYSGRVLRVWCHIQGPGGTTSRVGYARRVLYK